MAKSLVVIALVIIFLLVPCADAIGADPVWTQTTQVDFDGGTLNQVDTSSSPGDVRLAQVGWGSYSSELLTNPGAETGDTTGWTAEGSNTGNFAAGADCPSGSAGAHSGSYCFFWNGPSASDDWAYQEVDLSAYLAQIQAGDAQIRAGGWLVCSEYHVPVWDSVRLRVVLYDSGHTAIGTIYDTGEMNISSWAEYLVADYDLPANAQYARLYFQTYEPAWDAGNADDLTVTVRLREYYSSGSLESSTYDCGYKTNFNTISFTAGEPTGSDVGFQLRTADTEANLATATWYGPTGTGDYYQTSGAAINPVHIGDQWIQYKAFFTTADVTLTPTLSDVSISYSPQEPVADFSATPREGEVPLTVRFSDASSGGTITSFSWDFGDGGTSSEQNPTHTYTSRGMWTVSLTVDGPGGQETETKDYYISVLPATRPAVVDEPAEAARLSVRNLQITPVYAQPGQAVAIYADVANDGGAWGSATVNLMLNGQFEQSQGVGVSPGTAQPISFTVYKVEAGEYQVDVDGAVGTFYVVEEAQAAPQGGGLLAGGELGTAGIITIVFIGVILIAGIVIVVLLSRRA